MNTILILVNRMVSYEKQNDNLFVDTLSTWGSINSLLSGI